MTRFLLALLTLGVIATGCMSPAQRLDLGVVKTIREGKTTRDEVHKTLGKPREEVTGSNQKRLATYSYGRINPDASVPTPSIMPNKAGTYLLRTVSVIYDEHETVEKLIHYETTTPVYQQMSTVWVGPPITDRETSRIIKGASSEGELESLFGPPQARTLTIEGTPVLVWWHVQVKSRFQLREAHQTLFVYFDRLGIAQDYAVVGTASPNEKKRQPAGSK